VQGLHFLACELCGDMAVGAVDQLTDGMPAERILGGAVLLRFRP
jgi:hypothetical protein